MHGFSKRRLKEAESLKQNIKVESDSHSATITNSDIIVVKDNDDMSHSQLLADDERQFKINTGKEMCAYCLTKYFPEKVKSEGLDVPLSTKSFSRNNDKICTRTVTPPDKNSELMTKLDQILKSLSQINIRLDTLESKIEANTTANEQELAILKHIAKKNIEIPQTQEFPLKTLEDLQNMETKIQDDLYKYVNIIKTIISPEGLLENFTKIVDLDIILSYNYDGVQNKNTFKDLKNLNMAIFEATKCEGTTLKDYAEKIRKCLKVHKARHFRKLSYNKKTVAHNSN